MTSAVRSRPPALQPYAETAHVMPRVDNGDVLRFLSDSSLGKRNAVLEELRLELQVADGRQPFADPRQIFRGFAVALGDEAWDTRYQCVKLIGDLVPLLEAGELDSCMNVVLVPLVACLGDAKMTVGMAAGQTLGAYAERTRNYRRLADAVQRHGLEARDPVVRKGALMNLSFVCVPEQRSHDFRSFVVSLVNQLSDEGGATAATDSSRASIMHCLEKISGIVGRERFDSYLSAAPASSQDCYLRLLNGAGATRTRSEYGGGNSAVSAADAIRKRRTSIDDTTAYGIVPGRILEQLSSSQRDSRLRIAAAEELRVIVEDGSSFHALRPHVPNFLRYITSLLEDGDNVQVSDACVVVFFCAYRITSIASL
jgi:hypothetical protein